MLAGGLRSVVAAVVVVSVAAALAGCGGDTQAPSAQESSESAGTPTPTESAEPTTSEPPSPRAQRELDERLIDAAWHNDVPRARRLIARGANVNTQDETQQSAYLIAASEGYLRLLDLTLRNGARVQAKDSFNGTALIRAADRGHWHVVGRLLRAGVDRNHVNNLGWTALDEAVLLGDGGPRYQDTVRVLVAGGVDVGRSSPADSSVPAEEAARKGYDGMASLLRRAAGVEPGQGRSPAADRALLAAAADGDADAAALALRARARLEARDDRRRTALLTAASLDRLRVARLLVALGADPDALDDRHDTPWLVTGVTGSVPMAELLLTSRPDLTIRNRYGGLSIIPASERGHVAYVRRVARTDIDINHVNDLGWTALLEAVILGDGSRPYQQIVRILLDAGADPAIADRDGTTAAEHAAARGQDEVAEIIERRSG